MWEAIKKFFRKPAPPAALARLAQEHYDAITKAEDGEPEYDIPTVLRKQMGDHPTAPYRPKVRPVKLSPPVPPPPSSLGPTVRPRATNTPPSRRYDDDSSFVAGMLVGEMLSGSSIPIVPPDHNDAPTPEPFVAQGGSSGGGGATGSWDSSPSVDNSASTCSDDFSNVDSGSSSTSDSGSSSADN